jgi:hypothetical protein|tara:strand:- start:361 stop:540 length:180 start_codon:yes stop_codon:yes gene_type:complete
MILFDDFQDALEEAAWCADNEKQTYAVVVYKTGFRVSRLSRMYQYKGTILEVGHCEEEV